MSATLAENNATPTLSIPNPLPGAGLIPGVPGSFHIPGSPDVPGLDKLPLGIGKVFGGGGSSKPKAGSSSGSSGGTAATPGAGTTKDASALHPLILQLGVALLAVIVLVEVAGASRRGAQIAGTITVTLWLLWMIQHQSAGYSGLGVFAGSGSTSTSNGGAKAA